MGTWTARLGLTAGAILVAGLVACGGGEADGGAAGKSEGGSSGASAAGTIDVALNEWSIKPATASAKAGSVTFNTTNKGATAHELAVYQTDADPKKLPQAAGVVDEKKVTVLGRTASLDAGKVEKKTFELKAGEYVLVCNLPAHYGQGMYTTFTVE